MGCGNSKQVLRGYGHETSPPYACTCNLPMHSIGSTIPRRNIVSGDVTLTFSTLGSLLDNSTDFISDKEMMKITNDRVMASREGLFVAKEAISWSDMIGQRLHKTPTMIPPEAEPETINAWELMAGLEDASPIHPAAIRCALSLNSRDVPPLSELIPLTLEQRSHWMQPQLGIVGDPVVSGSNPEILSSFREAFEKLTPEPPSEARQSAETEAMATSLARSSSLESAEVFLQPEAPNSTSIVRARINAFQQRIDAKREAAKTSATKVSPCFKSPPDGKKKVVLYFTSLRGVRKTYEDCWEIRMLLKSYGVRVDERDISMHGGFKEDLVEILRPGYGGKALPRIFADGAYLGGAEEVRKMHEMGELRKALEGCETTSEGEASTESVCEGCADVRFVPCDACSGSCKIYVEQKEDNNGDGKRPAAKREELGRFRRCPHCNENGLVRCPVCL